MEASETPAASALSGADWLDQLPPGPLARAGEKVLDLLADPARWIHRRVERVEFADDRFARHRVSVDFSLPPEAERVADIGGQPVFLAPLFLLPKDHPKPEAEPGRSVLAVYSNLDLADGTGAAVPLVSRRTGSKIAGAILVARALQILGPEIGDLRNRITGIAVSDSLAVGTPSLHYVMEERCDPNDDRTFLRLDPTFSELAYAFASHWLVVYPILNPHPLERTIIKLAYNKLNQPTQGSLGTEILKGLGWKSTIHGTRLTQIGGAASYHLEIKLPPELEATEVGIYGRPYKLGWGGTSTISAMRRPEPHGYFIRQPEIIPEAHIYLTGGPERRIGGAWAKLRARRSGFLIGAFVATGVISLTLFLYAAYARDIELATSIGGSSAAITALLLIPTLVAAYIARPGEHATTSRMLRLLRFLLVADGGLTFIAGLIFLKTRVLYSTRSRTMPLKVNEHQLNVLVSWLSVLSWISLVFLIIFAVSARLPRPHLSWEYRLGDEPEPDQPRRNRRLIFGRFLPRLRAEEAYVTTLRRWRQAAGGFPTTRADEAYLTTLRTSVRERAERDRPG